VDERYNLAVCSQYHAPTPDTVGLRDATIRECPPVWWHGYEDLMQYLDPHMVPRQEAEAIRLLGEYGVQRFAGLDLFGIGDESFHARA
jgi:hypothetical protein